MTETAEKPQPICFLEEYLQDILDGKIVACQKMSQLARMLIPQIRNGYKQWHWDEKYAKRAVTFIETFCKIPSGKLGAPFILEPWERAVIECIFGFVDDKGFRRFREALVIIARKNGKTSLAAAIELYMLIADGEGAPQIYNVATKEEQAALAYNACKRMRSQSKDISKHTRPRTKDLFCDNNMGYIRPLSGNTTALDGLDVHMGVIDELAAIRDRDLYDLIRQGMSARQQPLLLEITTNGFVRNGIFDAQYEYAKGWLQNDGSVNDDRFVAFIYELDSRDEWDKEDCWIKANPALGTVKGWEYLRNNVQKAKEDSTFRATVMTKDFNVPENQAVAWLKFEEAVNEETYNFKEMGFRYGVCGFDASDTIDLTCAQMLMMRPGDNKIYERSMYWIPEDVVDTYSNSGDRKERDLVPYQQWIARGLLRTVPGNKIDKNVLIEWLQELRDEEDLYCYAVGVDPWHMDDNTLRNLENFVGRERVFKVRQGAQTLSQPMKQIKADYAANRIVDNHNPINEWCRMNVCIKSDENLNIKPVKKMTDPRNRIDGFAAEIDAYITLYNLYEDYTQIC